MVDMVEEEDRVSQEDAEPAPGSAEDAEELDSHEEEGDDEEEFAEEHEMQSFNADAGTATVGSEIDVNSFDELQLDEASVVGAQEAWRTFINSASSREAAGEAIYAALFDAAPSLQSLFTTPRPIQAMKFMNGLNRFVNGLNDPPALKIAVETLGFGHLAFDVTIPRVVVFRDAILDLFQVELGSLLTSAAYTGWRDLLNYVGGAIIYIKAFYADRIRLLGTSWALANDRASNKAKFATLGTMDGIEKTVAVKPDKQDKAGHKGKKGAEGDEHADVDLEKGNASRTRSIMQNVPTTFKEMFQFNAAVMGFRKSMWMNEVLACFDNIVSNVSNSNRLVEECDILVCRIARVSTGKVNLAKYKSCMLASLRSLLPKDWTPAHEEAWSWLWENVERLLEKNMGMPPVWENAYAKFLDSVDEATGFQMRKDIYLKFFASAPAGQNYFKQSNTYLHLVSTKVLVMVIDIYREPVRVVDDISALGLRHVGYGIPTEYMPPFVSACVEVVQGLTKDQTCVEGFQWSIGLIAKSLVRTILEGSTIVMKSINKNTKKSMVRALGAAPRGERNEWMLLIQVGTQDISPLAWSIESGALQSASAMICDLLVIRADRDKYYYGADDLFKRHHDIVKMILNDAPSLLPELLDGLIWRSRVTVNAQRRVNYYLKHLLIDPEGTFAKNMQWVAVAEDPKIVCHPVLVLLSDLVWARVACRSFLFRKSWFLFTLVLFVVSQAVMGHLREDGREKNHEERYATFGLRCLIYVFSMGSMVLSHARKSLRDFRKNDTFRVFGRVSLPKYLDNWQEVANFVLMFSLIVMVSTEPAFHCFGEEPWFTELCEEAKSTRTFPYSVFSMLSMILYYVLLVDLAVFNNRVSAFVLVSGRMIGEVSLFLLSLFMSLLTFASAFACLEQGEKEFHGIHHGALALLEMVLRMFQAEAYIDMEREPLILAGICVFVIVVVVFLLNMLVAQLTCAYDAVYVDMVGYARLKRIRVIVESMPQVTEERWEGFIQSLRLDQRIEFNEGDVGLSGGIQVQEPASAHPTTVDMIRRFGGATSPSMPWPKEKNRDDNSDRFQRLETMLKKTLHRFTKKRGRRGGGGGSSSAGMSGSWGSSEGGSSFSSFGSGTEEENEE